MADLSQLKCKQCGAPLEQPSGANRIIRCKYCGETMTFDSPEAPQPSVAPTPQVVYQVMQPQEPHYYASAPRYGNKSRGVAILLTFFLGYFGIHQFYLNRVGLGVLSLLFCWTFIPCIIALIDFIRLLCMDEASFNETFNRIS